ncbi:MAG: ATP-binding protein [Gammaproteobacteria bacterium]
MGELVQVELTIPMVADQELVAAMTAEQLAENLCFERKAVDQIRLAVIEACTNAFEHSESPDRRVYMNFLCDEDKLLIMVRDFGKGFDPMGVKEPHIREKLKAIRRRGWGLMLIRKLMDEVEFVDVAPEVGTLLCMTKYRGRPSCPAGTPAPS